MSLVNYSSSSDSECSSEIAEEPQTKRSKLDKCTINKKKFPIPEFIKKSRIVNEDSVVDRPEEHDGRIRSFDHVRGNWASLIYISVKSDFEELQKAIQNVFKNDITFKFSSEIHISLTRTFILHYHWISLFSESVLNLLKKQSIFNIRFGSLNIYTNEEKTRTFIGLTLDPSSSLKVEKLTNIIDKELEEYRLEKFYPEPLFHASILWCVGNQKALVQEKLSELNKVFDATIEIQPNDFIMNVDKIYIKIGNKYYNCTLKS